MKDKVKPICQIIAVGILGWAVIYWVLHGQITADKAHDAILMVMSALFGANMRKGGAQ